MASLAGFLPPTSSSSFQGRKPVYSMKEVALHASRQSLWIVIRGKVYDVTSFVQKHPGGAMPLLHWAGKDATEAASAAHKSSLLPPKMMKDYCVGTVAPDDLKGPYGGMTPGGLSSLDDDVQSALASVKPVSESEEVDTVVRLGQDALLALAEPVYRRLVDNPKLTKFMEQATVLESASAMRRFLVAVFESDAVAALSGSLESRPGGRMAVRNHISISADLLQGVANDLGLLLPQALGEVSRRGKLSPDMYMAAAIDYIREEKWGDRSVTGICHRIKAAITSRDARRSSSAVSGHGGGLRSLETSEDLQEEEEEEEDEEVHEEEEEAEDQDDGNFINVDRFEEFKMDDETMDEVQNSWKLFLTNFDRPEAAGDMVYEVLFEIAPYLRSLFVSPRVVIASRFIKFIGSAVAMLDAPAELKRVVQTLGFRHTHIQLSIDHCENFREALLGLLAGELQNKWTQRAENGWRELLNHISGALIYCRRQFADKLRIIKTSWEIANSPDTPDKLIVEEIPLDGDDAEANVDVPGLDEVPRTFHGMFRFNATVMGYASQVWIFEVLEYFENLVKSVDDAVRLHTETQTLAVSLSRRPGKGDVPFDYFKSVMMASFRSLVPKEWDSEHENAWLWFWKLIESGLKDVVGKPLVYEATLSTFLQTLDEVTILKLRKDIYARFFALAPHGQNYFKQSTTRLHFIVDKVLELSTLMYRSPKRVVEEMSPLGLRHVGYGIPTDLFRPFVRACNEVLLEVLGGHHDAAAVSQAFRWSTDLVSRILVRNINEGSTVVMQAINANSAKMIREAVALAPRGQRAHWVLFVQVGTESISPFYNALDRGSLEAASAILKDLLIIRADRDKYYYGADELFSRHPDVVWRLAKDAPVLVFELFDGLVWRSRFTEGGKRRVNYYIKNLVQDTEGGFSPIFKVLSKACNPKFVCHPIIELTADLVWGRLVYRTFLIRKTWFFFNFVVFVVGQCVFAGHAHVFDHDIPLRMSVLIFCRCLIYGGCLSSLLFHTTRRCVRSWKTKEITWVRRVLPVPAFLLEEWQEAFNVVVIIALLVMLGFEPLLWCLAQEGGAMFDNDGESCEETLSHEHMLGYTTTSGLALFAYATMMLDLATLSMRVSAFVLSCWHVIPEVFLYLIGVVFSIIGSSLSIAALQQEHHDFHGVGASLLSTMKMLAGMYNKGLYSSLHQHEAFMFPLIYAFYVVAAVFLTNMLVAQLISAYAKMHKDMVGYARLNRAEMISTWQPMVPARRWKKFLEAQKFEDPIEFNEGDIGLPGGVTTWELATAKVVTHDQIRRHGGSTQEDNPWPDEQDIILGELTEEDKIERIQVRIQTVMKEFGKALGAPSLMHCGSVRSGSVVDEQSSADSG